MAPADPPFLTIKTNFTPPVTFNPFQKADLKKSGVNLLSILQPAVSGELPIIGKVNYAPKGEPTGYGTVLMLFVGALALYGAYKLLK